MRRKIWKYCFSLLLLGHSLFCIAQLTKFHNLTMADGLSASIVYCIGQDKYGYIWAGTENGLNIYDGIRFRHLFSEEGNEMSIPGDTISDMVFTGDSVWIGTRNGLCVMDIKSKKSHRIGIGNNCDIRRLFLDRRNRILWVGTNSGLIKYSLTSGEFNVFNTRNSNISHDIVRSIYKDSEGNLWVGTFNMLNKLLPNSTIFEAIDLRQSIRQKTSNHLILSILPSSPENDSLLWIGTQTGMVKYNRHTSAKEFFHENNSGLSNEVIKVILTTNSGKVWLGTDFGLAEMDAHSDFDIHMHDPYNKHSITNSIVWDIFKDKSGAVWFGTNNGISILSNTFNRFRFFPMAMQNNGIIAGYEVRGIMEDSNEDFWLATQQGVIQYNPDRELFKTYFTEQALVSDVKSVFKDSKGRIWIATNGGVGIWNPITKEQKKYTADFRSNNGLRTNYIGGFFEFPEGVILINTNEGLHKAIESEGEIAFEFISQLRIDGIGPDYLWSYNHSELLRINPETLEKETELSLESSSRNNGISSLQVGNDQKIWLGGDNELIEYDWHSGEYQTHKIRSDKSYPLINLVADIEGNIWGSSYTAILKFQVDSEVFEIYPSSEEIPINRFIKGCCLKTKKNDLIFGGQDGFIKLSTENITKSEFISPVRFTRLLVSNNEIFPETEIKGKSIIGQEIGFTKNLTLDYSNGSFSIEFSSLHFGNRDGIRYSYILEGEENEWNYINGDIGIATYSKLRSGKYLLRVKGTNADGVWNENEASLSIKIKPPPWAGPGLIVIYFVLLFLIVGGLIYFYSNQIKWKNQMEIARLEKEHAEIVAKSRQQFLTNIAHEFRTPLSLIIGPVEKLAKHTELDRTGRSFIRLIENNARRLRWLNNQLLDFRKIENKSMKLEVSEFDIIEFTQSVFTLFTDKAERKHIAFSFHSDLDSLVVKMDLRKVETILFNLLSNAFKFTPEKGSISVTAKTCDGESVKSLCISVQDSGIGISERDQKQIFKRFYQAEDVIRLERGSGIGLTLVDEYVQMHNGEIVLHSQPGRGSDFQIILPMYNHDPAAISSDPDQEFIQLPVEPEKTDSTIDQPLRPTPGNPYILLVEDDKETADFICLSLKEKYNVLVASNGIHALEIISEQLPRLVVSDIQMPEMDGIEFIRKFKSNSKTSHIPFILLTGQSEKDMQLEGLKSGADAYVVKPFEMELLEIRINNFIKRREQFTEFLKQQNISKPKAKQVVSQDEIILEKVVDCLEKYMSSPDLNIEKVCAITGFSHAFLYRKIKSLTGQTVSEFIRTIRLQRAEQLLRTKKFTVAEVMHETGFSNHSYFSKCFRKQYHISPKQYAKDG